MSDSESDFENFCGSEEHPVIFEIVEEVLESSPQPEDVDLATLDDHINLMLKVLAKATKWRSSAFMLSENWQKKTYRANTYPN
jgi:hypothetical protein